MLWIKGGPGMGKTMLLCGLINEVEPSTRLSDRNADTLLSYFFCQATDVRFNNGTAVLRNLIHLLIIQRPSLIWRLREKYDLIGRALFEKSDPWDDRLAGIFIDILRDLSGTTTYLVIDALDECIDMYRLVGFILGFNDPDYSHVKWIVSSRETHIINQFMRSNDFETGLSIELNNTASVSDAVNIYIDRRVAEIESLQDNDALQERIRHTLRHKTDGTFLWVSLVIQQLQTVKSGDIETVINAVPTDLNEIYAKMIEQIHKQYERKYCLLLLSAAALAYRPLHLLEVAVVSGLSLINAERVEELVKMCGSFLTIRGDHVFIIHRSAKDYINQDNISLQLPGVAKRHVDMIKHSFSAIARLKKNIYNIEFGLRPKYLDTQTRHSDTLAPVRYSCIFWADHLCQNGSDPECKRTLTDDGVVFRFLKTHFLRWLESLSLLRSLSAGVKSIRELLQVVCY